MDMWGVVPCTSGVLSGEAQKDISKLKDHPLFEGMLVCHNLTLINGEICGDPLDAKVRDKLHFRVFPSRCNFSCVTDVREY